MGTKTTGSGVNYLKYSFYFIGLVFVLLLFRKCICNQPVVAPVHNDTVIKYDTQWLQSKIDTVYQPTLVKETPSYEPIMSFLEDTTIVDCDSIAKYKAEITRIMKDFNTGRLYNDTIPVKYGTAIISTGVKRNRLLPVSFKLNQDIPEVTTTKTITLTQPKRGVVYVGAGVIGGPGQLLWGAKWSVGYKSRNDKFYNAGAIINQTGVLMYSFDFNLPIKFRK